MPTTNTHRTRPLLLLLSSISIGLTNNNGKTTTQCPCFCCKNNNNAATVNVAAATVNVRHETPLQDNGDSAICSVSCARTGTKTDVSFLHAHIGASQTMVVVLTITPFFNGMHGTTGCSQKVRTITSLD